MTDQFKVRPQTIWVTARIKLGFSTKADGGGCALDVSEEKDGRPITWRILFTGDGQVMHIRRLTDEIPVARS